MATISQPIDQPTLPPMGDADPAAVLAPACTALTLWTDGNQLPLHATQVDNKKPVASVGAGARGATLGKDKNAGNYRNYAKMESSKLDTYIRDRVPEVLRLHTVFYGRVRELVQALLEMKSRFDNQGTRNDLHDIKVAGWHDYLKSVSVNPNTFRSWKHRDDVKQLTEMVDPTPAPAGRKGGDSRGGGKSGTVRLNAVRTAAKNLAQAKAEFGKAAADGNEHAAEIIAQYEMEYAEAIQAGDESSAPVVESKSELTSELTPTPVASPEEKDREQLVFLVKRLNSLSIALQQVVDGKVRWSKYAEYAEVVSAGEEIADSVKLLRG